MPTAEKEKTNKTNKTNAPNDKKWKSPQQGNLPPLCILIEDGDPCVGKLVDVTLIPGGKKERDRFFYRVMLTEPLKAMDKTKTEVEFEAGKIISIPGSGSLDYQMAICAAMVKGDLAENASFTDMGEYWDGIEEEKVKELLDHLKDHEVKIARGEDETMKEGKYKNKPVKRFSVAYL